MSTATPSPWKVSLHGGHSGPYCDHATGTLPQILDAAVAAGYSVFGVTEHAPRMGENLLYSEEIAMGWDVARLEKNFAAYVHDLDELAQAYSDRLTVLKGFETEVVPSQTYRKIMLGLRESNDFDYIVGSVHHVNEILIDGPPDLFEKAADSCGGLEPLAVAYYEAVAEMVRALHPEVVGHLDLIRKNAPTEDSVDTPMIRRAAETALQVIGEAGCILDLNVAGYRRGLGRPYPAPWLVKTAFQMNIPFCFGDDSHAPAEVGAGLEDGKSYLIENGVQTITALIRKDSAIIKQTVPIDT